MAEDPGGAAAPTSGAKRRRRRRRPKARAAVSGTGTPTTADGTDTSTSSDGQRSGGRRRKRAPAGSGSKAAAERTSQTTRTTKASAGRRRTPASKRTRKRGGHRGAASAAKTKREISAGGVVYRREGDEIEVVLASRRTRRGDLAWGLAKGGIEDGESMEDAAVREVREETGLRAEIETSLGETRYFYVWEDVRIRKTVHFFLMRSVGGNPDDRDDEMEEIRWFPLERALKRAAYRGERDVLQRAAELLR